ncbi:MAG: Type 1 glutamine amidotransferase-like domain-containing protein [Bacillota bacterium]|nr:Type 1 glutamine amidotransferase-like domain-containing protein [Bacillota bacterium]
MHIFLTSSPFGDYRSSKPAPFIGWNPNNSFLRNISSCWKENAHILYVAADPWNYSLNNQIQHDFRIKFLESKLSFCEIDICDYRYQMHSQLNYYDVIILGGGHVPTQNRFLKEINLPQEIQDFSGIVIGISAGSMNCAKLVYAQPEEQGETRIPHEQRFISGLAITNVNVLPHYNATKNDYVDNLRLYEDITFSDSYHHSFIVLEDGSYIYQKDGRPFLFGTGYQIKDGQMKRICQNEEFIDLEKFI